MNEWDEVLETWDELLDGATVEHLADLANVVVRHLLEAGRPAFEELGQAIEGEDLDQLSEYLLTTAIPAAEALANERIDRYEAELGKAGH